MSLRTVLLVTACGAFVVTGGTRFVLAQDPPQSPKVTVNSDGTVEIPAESVPLPTFLSSEAKAYVTEHLHQMQDPEQVKQDGGVPRFMRSMLARDREIFAVDKQDGKIGGVHTYTYTPQSGIQEKNKRRVLINLHGGGFSGCWPACAELESIPIASLMKIKVVTVDYREGPENKFPSASEDVASVYRELLKNYKPESIGIYGCSAGGMLTAVISVHGSKPTAFHHQELSVFIALRPGVSEAMRPILPFHLEKGACRCRVPPELRSWGISAMSIQRIPWWRRLILLRSLRSFHQRC